MENVIDIHPLDLGDILNKMAEPELTILELAKSTFKTEFVVVVGQVYRQTMDVPVTSEYGKRILKQIEK
jgi:hypothetical protein